jgi:hypothetical protein
MAAAMTDLFRGVVGGSVAALAAALLFIDATASAKPAPHLAGSIAASADRTAPILPYRARLLRLSDEEARREHPVPFHLSVAGRGHDTVPSRVAGEQVLALALVGLYIAAWFAGRRRLRAQPV